MQIVLLGMKIAQFSTKTMCKRFFALFNQPQLSQFWSNLYDWFTVRTVSTRRTQSWRNHNNPRGKAKVINRKVKFGSKMPMLRISNTHNKTINHFPAFSFAALWPRCFNWPGWVLAPLSFVNVGLATLRGTTATTGLLLPVNKRECDARTASFGAIHHGPVLDFPLYRFRFFIFTSLTKTCIFFSLLLCFHICSIFSISSNTLLSCHHMGRNI